MNSLVNADGRETVPLVDDLLRSGRLVRLRVTGKSMTPWLEDGVVVTLQRVPIAALSPGDVVLFRAGNGQPVLHRIIRREQAGHGTLRFLVKGDACATPDGFVSGSQIVGKLVGVAREAPCGGRRDVMRELLARRSLDRLLAIASRRSPRLFHALSLRLVSLWRNSRMRERRAGT